MTKAARQILEACTSSGPENITAAELNMMVWGLAKTMPFVLDAIDELRRRDAEADEYISIFRLSKCAVRWVTNPTHIKYGLALLGVIGIFANAILYIMG